MSGILQLEDFSGHEHLVKWLRRGRLPQSSLFAGPSGVGKKTLALMLAALANCRQPSQDDLCGHCSSCRKIAAGHHPDVFLIDRQWITDFLKPRTIAENVIPIDVIRTVNREAQYRPFEGRYKFFIIDEAEKMNVSAANALLKTLEEPPSTTRITLVTSVVDRLLPTVRSRCQSFYFRPLSRQSITGFLTRTGELERPELRAAFAEGSLATALTLDLEATLEGRDWVLKVLERWLKKKSFEDIYRFCEDKTMRAELKTRDGVRRLLGLLQKLVQDLYCLLAGTPERATNQDRLDILGQLSSHVSLEWVADFLYHIREAQEDVERYVNPLMCFETLWLQSQVQHA